jgi:hypothetical protein
MPHTPIHVFSRRLNQGAHSRRFSVDMEPGIGWQVRDEGDAQPLRERIYDDWHRVELAISRFAVEAARLSREGWQEA